MSNEPAVEAGSVSVVELRAILRVFASMHSNAGDLATRFIALRAAKLANEVTLVVNRETVTCPEMEAGIKELRLSELKEKRRQLSKELNMLDREEQGIIAINKTA